MSRWKEPKPLWAIRNRGTGRLLGPFAMDPARSECIYMAYRTAVFATREAARRARRIFAYGDYDVVRVDVRFIEAAP